MPKKRKVNVSGNVSSGKNVHGEGNPSAEPSYLTNEFWVSHRKFQFHAVKDGCDPMPADNVGYIKNAEKAINQGFAPCPICVG